MRYCGLMLLLLATEIAYFSLDRFEGSRKAIGEFILKNHDQIQGDFIVVCLVAGLGLLVVGQIRASRSSRKP